MRFVILLCAIFLNASASHDCDTMKCPAVPKHYEEFGCNPVVEDGKCCPSHFDCSSLKNRDNSKCYYNNTAYSNGEKLLDDNIASSCTVGCFCRDSNFVCAHIDCPEFFGVPVTGKKCISQYDSKSCCSTGSVCGEDLEKLTKCEFGGKSYYEGERIDTGRSCYSCFCGKGFEDKPFQENKHCHKVNCNMEVHYSQQITDGCVPIYWKTDDCCPIEWRCPDKETKVVPDSSRKSTEVASDIGCTFGGLKMNVGDFLSPENDYDQCTICSCKVPPFPHCIKTC